MIDLRLKIENGLACELAVPLYLYYYITHNICTVCSPRVINVFVAGTPPVTRVTRPPRSRSAGGKETSSPLQSPFRRNRSTTQSSRHQPAAPISRSQTPTPRMSRRSPDVGGQPPHQQQQWSPSPATPLARNNTWNAAGGRHWTAKQRPQLSADTFCQQVADIINRYAVMAPSPRKDSKPDSPIVTRIPAPVQKT